MLSHYQTTLARPVSVSGVGVHSGAPVTAVFHPAPVGAGLQFRRKGENGTTGRTFRAHADHVGATALCTVLGDVNDGGIATVEHILAALRGMDIDNALVVLDGAETPIADGSSATFVDALLSAGLAKQDAPRRFLKVLKPVRVEQGSGWAELHPYAHGFRLEVDIDFDHRAIGRQSIQLDLTPKTFRKELSFARTFGFMKDVEKLLQLGFARGSSLDNSVVVDEEGVVNPDGLRAPDEFVRHKTLDAVGDLALAGLPILGLYRSYRGGHHMNISTVRALYADPSAWTVVEGAVPRRAPNLLPGLQPAFGNVTAEVA
jgi:UDP-3-O-[3-hydroxymyristoyl] N-acetylglucosamine deacetylase